MTYNQPFPESTTNNPWAQQDGPRFGNAYETNTNQWTPAYESNKTEYIPSSSPPLPAVANPYQYTGTRLGQQDVYGSENAYSGINNPPSIQQPTTNDTPIAVIDDHKPNKWRLLLRVILLVAAVGHLGFAAGASPKSGVPPPLTASGCFYYLFAVASMTILYSLYHIGYYCFRRYMHGMKTSRPLMMAADVILTVMWGVGIIIEAARYKCPPGQYNGWCDFYNVSIFFGFVCFAGFAVAVIWDLVGACKSQRRSTV